MGRQPRAEFRNALYHVFARGNRRERIFHDHDDYQLYIEELQKLSRDLGVDVLAYCLMPNHPHLCLRTRDTPLSRFMQRLNTFHAKRFNQKYDTCGHLYQGRYRALLIEERMYLLRLVRYIHQNPTRAGLVASMSDWPYSSYHEYRRADSWICRGPVLSGFGSLAAFAAFERDTPAPEDLETFSRARRAFAFAGSPDLHCRSRGRRGFGNLESPAPSAPSPRRFPSCALAPRSGAPRRSVRVGTAGRSPGSTHLPRRAS